ncbi:MAG TPA: nuclear transport factor 2 family protein [Candidatus Acidoferrales bacterium]|jgi:hypothetical protein|nr:nuclear transport factor 2 family protein [Candidatus Acidoferrales bacterium]
MRKVMLLCCFTALLLIGASTTSSNPELSSGRSADEAAVRATVNDYIQAYYTADPARMERALHPHYLKHTISGPEGAARMTEKTGLQMVQAARAHVRSSGAIDSKLAKVTVLDVDHDIASAKLVTSEWVDYLMLTKSDRKWRIVSVVLREQ